LQAISDLALDPARCAILGDRMSDIEAGAAAGICLRFSSGRAMPKRAEHLMKWSPILPKRSHSLDPALRQLCLISAPGIPDARPFKLELGFAAVRWNRRACPRLMALGAV
jgi:hypothetical protein